MATTHEPTKIIGYARISREKEESTSIIRQHEIIETTAASRGLDVVAIVDDIDLSASVTRLDRPGLDEVRRRVVAGEADAVMVWRLDRIARSVVDFSTIIEGGVPVISATEPIDTTTPMGKAMAQIIQVFAELEAKTISLRVKSAQTHLMRVGRWTGGVVPFGYKAVPHPDGAGWALDVEPGEAQEVQRMAQEVFDGVPITQIAKRLNTEGVRARRGGTWTTTRVRKLLLSDVLLGRVTSNGDAIRDERGLPITFWTPILTAQEAERIRAILGGRKSSAPAEPRLKASRLLSGLLHCPGCNLRMVVRPRHPGPGHQYVCPASSRGMACEAPTTVDADRVEAEVTWQFLDAVGALEVTEEVVTPGAVVGLVEVEDAIRVTTDAMREPDADLGALVERLTGLRQERERLLRLPSVPTTTMVGTGKTFADTWAGADVRTRRSLLASSGVLIELARAEKRGRFNPDRVSLHWTD